MVADPLMFMMQFPSKRAATLGKHVEGQSVQFIIGLVALNKENSSWLGMTQSLDLEDVVAPVLCHQS